MPHTDQVSDPDAINRPYDFDIAVSFAGEDRDLVHAVVTEVQGAGFTVFHDEDNPVDLWGEELTEYFANVYERRARYAVMFVSRHYAIKPWTRLERRSILVRALEQEKPYLLPVRLDSTELPGLRSSVGFLDATKSSATSIAQAIKLKLGAPDSSGGRRFNGRVPRTEQEKGILLGERPPGWEYLLLAYELVSDMEGLNRLYKDHAISFALPDDFVPDAEVATSLSRELADMTTTTAAFEDLLLGDAQRTALGAPGASGDPDLIEHFADKLIAIYAHLLTWAKSIRGHATESTEARTLFRALANFANQPIEEIRRYVVDFRTDMDLVTARLEAGETIEMERTIRFEVPDEKSTAFNEALEAFQNR